MANSLRLAVAASIVVAGRPVLAGLVAATYVGPNLGSWNTAANWSPALVPNDGADTYHAIVDPAAPLEVVLASSVGVTELSIAAPGAVRIPSGLALTINGPTVTNAGTIALKGGATTKLVLNAPIVTFSGGGAITMTNTTQNQIVGAAGAIRRLVNGADHIIRGSGSLGANMNLVLTNDGFIQAENLTALAVDMAGAVGDNINAGTIRAAPGGTLTVLSTQLTNTGGEIVALGGGTLVVLNSYVLGGTIRSEGTGVVRFEAFSTIEQATLDGTLLVPNGHVLHLTGPYVNDGTLQLGGAGAVTSLQLDGDTTFDGDGQVALSANAANRIVGVGGPRRLTLGPDQTLRGSGQVGFNTNFSMTSSGAVLADTSPGMTIDVTGDFTNLGLVQVLGAGSLVLGPGDFVNHGVVVVDAGRTLTRSGDFVQLAGATTVDGTLAIGAGGTLDLDGGTLDGTGTIGGPVVNDGGTVAPGGSPGTLKVAGAYAQGAGGALAATIAGAGPGQSSVLAVTGAAALGGTLVVTLDGGFVPAPTDEFTILTAAAVSGTFAAIESDETIEIVQGPTSVVVRFPCAGRPDADLDGGGVVDGADLGILLGQWGACGAPCCAADLDDDGVVDGADLGVMLGSWG